MLVEFGDVCSLDEFKDFFQEVVVVSKQKAIITTMAPKDVLEPILTAQNKANPLTGLTCFKFRKALGLPSIVWLKPSLTEEYVDRARKQAANDKKAPKDKELASLLTHLRVEGLPQVGHEVVCCELMQSVCAAAGLNFVRSLTDTLSPNQWAICYRGDGTFAQQIVVQTAAVEDVKALLMKVHGSGVKVAGRNLAIEVRASHPTAEKAGMCAANIIASPSGVGQCL
jgi:hypothetical protein